MPTQFAGYAAPPSYPPPTTQSSSSPIRGLIGGFVGVVVYAVLSLASTLLAAEVRGDYVVWLAAALRLVCLIAVLGVVFASAERRRGAVAGALFVAGVLLLLDILAHFAFRWHEIDWLNHVVMSVYLRPEWPIHVVSALAFAAVLTAWFLGRRASLAPLVLVPLATTVDGIVSWAIGHWAEQATLDRFKESFRGGSMYGGDMSRRLDEMRAVAAHYNLIAGALLILTAIVTFVGAAWVGVAIDRVASPSTR